MGEAQERQLPLATGNPARLVPLGMKAEGPWGCPYTEVVAGLISEGLLKGGRPHLSRVHFSGGGEGGIDTKRAGDAPGDLLHVGGGWWPWRKGARQGGF